MMNSLTTRAWNITLHMYKHMDHLSTFSELTQVWDANILALKELPHTVPCPSDWKDFINEKLIDYAGDLQLAEAEISSGNNMLSMCPPACRRFLEALDKLLLDAGKHGEPPEDCQHIQRQIQMQPAHILTFLATHISQLWEQWSGYREAVCVLRRQTLDTVKCETDAQRDVLELIFAFELVRAFKATDHENKSSSKTYCTSVVSRLFATTRSIQPQ